MAGDNCYRPEIASRAFDLLADERRLYAVLCLREAKRPMSVRELAAEIAARERDARRDGVPDGVVARVEQSLYHVHLPKLQEASVVEYNRATEFVVFSNNAAEVEAVVDAVFGAAAGEASDPRERRDGNGTGDRSEARDRNGTRGRSEANR